MTPRKRVVEAPSYAEANIVATSLDGKKIPQQAWALSHNIAVVESIAAGEPRIIEVHPEVSFRTSGRGRWVLQGQLERTGLAARALEREGILLPDHLDEAGQVTVADVLDAAAEALSARRFARRETLSLAINADRGDRQATWH